MSLYDKNCAREFSLIKKSMGEYFAKMAVDCPYKLPRTAVFYQALCAPLPDRAMELFLAAGYRRNGNCLYTMQCENCRECVPIRLHPRLFCQNRNQRRTRRKNEDLEVVVAPVEATEENLALCEKFLSSRYPREDNRAKRYYSEFFVNTVTTSMEIRYRLDGQLVGNAIIDVGENWMNGVYYYFDPSLAKRSLGTFNILTMVALCLEYNIEYLYLGYYIKNVAAMNYKKRFKPCFVLKDSGWQEG